MADNYKMFKSHEQSNLVGDSTAAKDKSFSLLLSLSLIENNAIGLLGLL